MNLDKIDHIAIQVNDIKKSLNWYLKNFRCKKIYSDNTWAFIEFNNIKLALVKKEEHPSHFAVVDDNITMKEDIKKHRDNSISKYIDDPDKNKIELIKFLEKNEINNY